MNSSQGEPLTRVLTRKQSTLRHWAYRDEVLALPGDPPEILTLDKEIVWVHLGKHLFSPIIYGCADGKSFTQITASKCCV